MTHSNQTINQLMTRRSVREFTGEETTPEDLALIMQAAQRAPTSINGQQVTLIWTRDKAKIREIVDKVASQEHIATADVFVTFVIDYNRTTHAVESTGSKHLIQNCSESIVTGSIDAGIMLSQLQTAAEALGYGTCAIGYVRNNPEEMIRILGLPPRTFPLLGTTIGKPTEAALNAPLKPRIPFENFAFEETYDDDAVKKGTEVFEEEFKTFREETGLSELPTYKEKLCAFYGKAYFNQTAKFFEKQGFRWGDEV